MKKLVVKVYNDEDPTSKTVAIDQTWTAWEVCKKMMRKNDTEPDPNWVLIERIPQLSIGWFVAFSYFCFKFSFSKYNYCTITFSNNTQTLKNKAQLMIVFCCTLLLGGYSGIIVTGRCG